MMAKLIGLKFWILCAAYLALGGNLALPWVFSKATAVVPLLGQFSYSPPSYQVIASIVWFLIAAFFLKPVWRIIWKFPFLGPWLSRAVFPDLNGHWNVEVRSNWPIIQKMRDAAKDMAVPRFDSANADHERPDLQVSRFAATINQGWLGTEVRFEPNQSTPLQTSTTLSVELLRKEGAEPKRVAWVYKQENSSVPAHTDEHSFLGAALLQVSDNGEMLRGKYWTNRSWDKGLNAAGEIVLTRTT